MADTYLEVTAGSGTKLHTYSRTVGGNTVHDEFTLPGEYPYASYLTVAPASVATTGDHVIQLMAGGSVPVRVRRIWIRQSAHATTAGMLELQLYRLTTAGTGGSAATTPAFDTTDSASGATARFAITSSKGTEGTYITSAYIWLSSSSVLLRQDWEWVEQPGQKPIIIPTGTNNGIALKVATGVAGASVVVQIEFSEPGF